MDSLLIKNSFINILSFGKERFKRFRKKWAGLRFDWSLEKNCKQK